MNKDEQQVSEFYHAQDSEKPSNELDMKILAQARENMPVYSQWRKWQWPASVAASVVFVSVIMFTQYSSFSPNIESGDLSPVAKVDPFALAEDATLDAEQQALEQKQRRQQQTEILAKRASQKQQAIVDTRKLSAAKTIDTNDSSSESLSQPELANYAKKEVATLAARALDDVVLDILPLQLEEPTAIDTGLNQEEIQVTGARVADSEMELATQFKSRRPLEKMHIKSQVINSDFLDELLANYADVKSQIEKLADQDSTQSKSLKAQIMDIQNTAFDHLNLLKLAEPNLKIQSRYLNMLSQQQQKILVPEQNNE